MTEPEPQMTDPEPSVSSPESVPTRRVPGSVKLHQGARLPDVLTRNLARELVLRLTAESAAEDLAKDVDFLARLGMELDLQLDNTGSRYGRRKVTLPLRTLAKHPGFSATTLPGATVLELGCGAVNPLGAVFVAVMAGASRGIGLDMDAPESIPVGVRALYRLACELSAEPARFIAGLPIPQEVCTAQLEKFNLDKLRRGDPGGIPNGPLQLMHCSASSIDLEAESVDVGMSVSFFEHVDDVNGVIAELARVTRPGGLGSHMIDGRDHRCYNREAATHPLEFLCIDSDRPIVMGCNRVRPLHFRAYFERHGFEVLQVQSMPPEEIPAELRERLVEPFRSMTDLDIATLGATYFVRRR